MMRTTRSLFLGLVAAMSMVAHAQTTPTPQPAPSPLFTPQERDAIMAYWAEPGRIRTVVPDNFRQQGLYRVRLTVAGSVWLREYMRARGLRVPPTQTAVAATNDEQRIWEEWIEAKIAYDRTIARKIAEDANAKVLGRRVEVQDDFNSRTDAPNPGPIPPSLVALGSDPATGRRGIGNPPPFAEAVVPWQYAIRFDDGLELTYETDVRMRPRYAFYRFEKGVMSAGRAVRTLSNEESDRLFRAAKVTPSEGRVMRAVSFLEGGFDSVNTYDTGFVSVGFIQFATLEGGGNSVGTLLKMYKQQDPVNFQRDFRRFGIDVTDIVNARGVNETVIGVLDLATGAELTGPEAAREVIEDKRLIAVFQRAGQKSLAYNAMQIRSAYEQYYPANDTWTVTRNGVTLSGKVSDIIKSEAGMATLMDRKVNTGRLDPLPQVLQQITNEFNVRSVDELARLERLVVMAMRYRKDYLADTSLSQPPLASAQRRTTNNNASRGGSSNRNPRSSSSGGSRPGNRRP